MSKKPETISLQNPVTDNNVSLIEALKNRRTNRDFGTAPISETDLSGIFWAAYGSNRPDGHKTVPAAWGLYALNIYAITADGAYIYNADNNSLEGITKEDLRALSGMQDYAAKAPLDIVVFVDQDKLVLPDKDMNKILQKNLERVANLDGGAVAQNINLYCASAGINVVERMMVAEDDLRKALGLKKHNKFVIALSAGYPPEN